MTNPVSSIFIRWAAPVIVGLALFAPVSAIGQESQQAPDPNAEAPPAATPGAGWTTQSAPGVFTAPTPGDAAPPRILTPDQITQLNNIDRYLNTLVNVKGKFVQTNHRDEITRGRFYVKRPGRIRFDYRSPSKLRIVSDGSYLSIEDHDLNTVDKFPLDSTPIRMLLGENVDLARDAVILDMRQDETAVALVLKDKGGSTSGHLQLYFRLPELVLYEWVITDAQGLDTRIQLADLSTDEEKSDMFFQSSPLELENISEN